MGQLNITGKWCGIYEIRHIESGKCYVGSSLDIKQRWHAHKALLRSGKHHSRRMQRAWTKYGADAFLFSILVICGAENLALYEQAAIDGLDAYQNGLNGAPFACTMRGTKHSDETKRLLSKIGRGRKHSPEHCAAISAAMTGKKLPPEVIEKMRKTKTGKVHGPPSDEHRAKISAALKGRTWSDEYLEKMRQRRHTDETKMLISISKAGEKMSAPRDPEHTRKQQEARMRTLAAKRTGLGV